MEHTAIASVTSRGRQYSERNSCASLSPLSLLSISLCTVSIAQDYAIFHWFDQTHGDNLYAATVQGNDGLLYGTTLNGGSGGGGIVYKIDLNGSFTVLHNFSGTSDGAGPFAALIQANDGNFYGTTNYGGPNNKGTIFKMTPSGVLTTLYRFCAQQGCSDGASPYAGLVQGSDGNLYGTAYNGGNLFENYCFDGCGTVFKITLDGTLTTLYKFCIATPCTDGRLPQAAIVLGSDGNLYGTTVKGGAHDMGTVFQIAPSGAFKTLLNFSGKPNDGAFPYSALVLANDGNFYGTTTGGGAYDVGTVFKVTSNGAVTLLHSFSPLDNNGGYPTAALMQASDGYFYGTTFSPNASFYGTVFTLTPAGALTTLHRFSGFPTDGDTPDAPLMQATDGRIYGTTINGGFDYQGWCGGACGAIFSLAPAPYLSVLKSGLGTVFSNDHNINCGDVCAYVYAENAKISLTAIPAVGYTFSSWSGCDSLQGNVCTVTISTARSASATFTVAPIALTSLVLQPALVKGGDISIATVTLAEPAPPGGFAVAVSSDHSLIVHPPSPVVIPGGRSSFSFAVRTSVVRTKTVAKVTAAANSSHVESTLTVDTQTVPRQMSRQ